MDITYLGPVDGHDVKEMVRVFNEAKRVDHAVLVHVLTKKGKGYLPAEENPAKFHGTGPFHLETGDAKESKGRILIRKYFLKCCLILQKKTSVSLRLRLRWRTETGLTPFAKHFPNRFLMWDRGRTCDDICGRSCGGGMKPIFAVYSSFLQRAYDQTLHDVCLQNLPVVIAVDRAGLVGKVSG